MSILDRVKNHISDNRGKYGVATGAGLAYGASQVPSVSPLINQAGFNLAAKGQNLALDAADKIGYGKEQLQNLGLENKIRPEDIQAGNEFYNSKVGQLINPNPLDITNAAEHSSKLYNQAQEVVNQAHVNGQNYIDKGINFVKKLNPFNENTLPSTIKIPIKSILLEGYQPEEITENVNRFLANNNTPQDRVGGIVGGIGIGGLPAGVIAAYGNISNQDRQYNIVNQSLVDPSNGAWDNSMIARGQYLNNMDNRASNLYSKNKLHYFLNPLTAGPISHMMIKGSRDINNGVYNLLKNKNSPSVQNKVTVVADPNDPFNSGIDTIRNSANNYADDIAIIRRNNPGHYFLNPLTAGPINEFLVGHITGGISQGIRKATTLNGQSGDTLVYNTGRR